MNLTAWTVFIFLALASIIAAAPDPGPTSSAVEDSALKVRSLLKRWNNNLICYEDGFQSTKVVSSHRDLFLFVFGAPNNNLGYGLAFEEVCGQVL